ncbi:MAG: hypothetical protein JWN86_4509 [Planctomycetota bacterium]|nr:hypothetical protein [Planctomycetota bacterium]
MPDRPPYSRFRRLPGLYRIGDVKPPDPHAEPQLLALYIPGSLLDRAEALAVRAGAATVQEYCEELLKMVIESEEAHLRAEAVEVKHDMLESMEAMASDPDYLADWNSSLRGLNEETADRSPSVDPPPLAESSASQATIFRHASVGTDDPSAFLATIRRGEAIGASVVSELLGALVCLEDELRNAANLDRRLAYALHRLAFEGQVLLTDSPSEAAADPATVDALRRVQEAVDRVLSGEDIRYFSDPLHPDGPH